MRWDFRSKEEVNSFVRRQLPGGGLPWQIGRIVSATPFAGIAALTFALVAHPAFGSGHALPDLRLIASGALAILGLLLGISFWIVVRALGRRASIRFRRGGQVLVALYGFMASLWIFFRVFLEMTAGILYGPEWSSIQIFFNHLARMAPSLFVGLGVMAVATFLFLRIQRVVRGERAVIGDS